MMSVVDLESHTAGLRPSGGRMKPSPQRSSTASTRPRSSTRSPSFSCGLEIFVLAMKTARRGQDELELTVDRGCEQGRIEENPSFLLLKLRDGGVMTNTSALS
jgi:hypothetical protein